ncbi:MAG: FAD:protein FMN transferase, partial [Exilispira sp.]
MNKKQLILIKFILFKILIIVCLIIFYFISFFSCSGLSQEKLIKEKRFLFDSFFVIIVISRDIEKAKYDLNQLFLSLENTGIQFDWRNENSYLSKISRFENIEIEEKYINFFKDIYYYHRFTKGYFNPFLRKLILAYNNFKDGTIPPDDQKIKELLKFIKKSEIYLDKNDKVFLKYPENLDLGAAIAGFLVDFSYDYLKNMGYNNFLINGSGEIRVSGNKYGKNWIIGIQS